MELEWLASTAVDSGDTYPFDIHGDCPIDDQWEPLQLDMRPMIRAIVADVAANVSSAVIAKTFHATLSRLILEVCIKLRKQSCLNKVVLSGGVFMNALLQNETEFNLKKNGFCPFHQSLVPANDGGLSLGQLAIAARQIGETRCV
jgi:hydrogenase maturation protein HypF